ncbi:ABC transporter permease [Micromonospora endophytica]|uniref:ABC transporter permease n=1 Tax=Micromonospora endophytica TaxID=515350 RepID=A0A2W2C425_9ACTN|nr:ABC transporter permease [Micromonospora endophytica]PZF92550.1 ABC transporter permease [Micromonospora endophytica]RIW44509.1 ABC transporter permease [Micromonospora endophytica]BCJ60465.1 ABC transporter permease [Micromonospora endophytica]
MSNLVRSELLKIRTTSTWWWLAIGALLSIGMAFPFNAWMFDSAVGGGGDEFGVTGDAASAPAQAANLYTSGQYLGLLFVMLIGILMVTNEFFHQTATTTFLATPRRTAVIVSKLIAASLLGFAFWLVTTVIDLAGGAIFLALNDYGTQLGEWDVQRALLLNLMAYAIWTVLGVGIGTLITNQLGAVITASVLYLIGTQVVGLLFFALASWLDNMAVLKWQVIWPAAASQIMITPGENEMLPAWWVGALVLIGYALVSGIVGVLLTRRRDIS